VNYFLLSESDCAMANGTFYYPSQSQDECLSHMYCWTPQSIVTGLLSPVDQSTGDCAEGGIKQSIFEWKKPKWMGGTIAYTNWTNRQPVLVNTIRSTIDFPRVQEVVSSPTAISVKTFLQNQV